MAIEETERPAELERLERVLEFCQRRSERAAYRLARAEEEDEAAATALAVADLAVSDWRAANPDPQMGLEL